MRRLLSWLIPLVLGLLLGLAWPYLHRPPVVLNQDAVYPGVSARAAWVAGQGGYLDIQPAQGKAQTLLILYPGGLVRPQAYQWLGTALASDGVRTIIPAFPLDFAFFAPDRAGKLLAALKPPVGTRVVLAGHSLGGVFAVRDALKNRARVQGLILLGSYPDGGTSLRGTDIRVLDLAAGRDGLSTPAKVRAGLARLPEGTQLTVIPGSVHAFFGRYGPQAGDGTPTVDRATAERAIVADIRGFLASLPQ